MSNVLFGLPLYLWGLICMAIAGLYAVLWPKPRPGQVRPAWAHLVLRWFHSLVWLLLAVACFLWALDLAAYAYGIAWLALPAYLAFITVTLLDRRPP